MQDKSKDDSELRHGSPLSPPDRPILKPAHEGTGSGCEIRSRRILAGVLLVASLLPFAAFIASGWSPFVTFWEFAAYRYFGAMSYFEPTTLPFWLVQGMPMALMQIIIMLPLVAFDRIHIGTPEQIELFSYASLLLAYVLIGTTLAICAFSRRLLMIDAAALGIAVLALFPMTRWYSYFFAPDYWIFELPMAIASTAWGIAVVRSTGSSSPLPGFWATVLAGAWIALCFTQKPSLAGLAAFPILFRLTMPAYRIAGKFVRCAVLIGAFLVAHTSILFALTKFNSGITRIALRNYWNWIVGSSSTGTSLVSFYDLLMTSGHLSAPIVIGCIVMVTGAAYAFLNGRKRRSVVAGMLLGAVLIGYIIVIILRPSGTSVIDLAIYGTCLIPLGLAIACATGGGYAAAAVLVIAAIVVPPVGFLPPPQPQSSMMVQINEAAAYVRSLKRPVLVVLHDNRAHPLTIEALALYTGQLPPVVGGSSWLREPFLGATRILSDPRDPRDLVPAIMRGNVIIWGSAPGAPAAETYYPDLKLLTGDKQAVLRTFEIEPGSHTAHIGYLPASCFLITNSDGSAPAHSCPIDTMPIGADRQR
jgi:hypothetical protein